MSVDTNDPGNVWAPPTRGTHCTGTFRVRVDKYGWPVTTLRGRPITNFLRRWIFVGRKTVEVEAHYWLSR